MQIAHLIGPQASAFVGVVSLQANSLPSLHVEPETGQTLHLWPTRVAAAAAAAAEVAVVVVAAVEVVVVAAAAA